MITQVIHDEKILAIILKKDFSEPGIHFFTPNNFSQQLGYMNHKKGHTIEPHVHNRVTREINYTNEVLFIKSGIVRVDFYSEDQIYVNSFILNQGDVILLSSGGHGFQIIEDAEIIEVKQGPYYSDLDKNRFKSVEYSNIFIKNE